MGVDAWVAVVMGSPPLIVISGVTEGIVPRGWAGARKKFGFCLDWGKVAIFERRLNWRGAGGVIVLW